MSSSDTRNRVERTRTPKGVTEITNSVGISTLLSKYKAIEV